MIYQAVFFLVLAWIIKKLFFAKGSKDKTVPGLKKRSPECGNIEDIGKAGSLHQFLLDLHHKYGDIASFWMGPQFVVSICSPDLFKEHRNVFDRPPMLFQLFEPFIGQQSLQYANKDDGKSRRKIYDRSMSHQSVKKYFTEFRQLADEIIRRLEVNLEAGIQSHELCTLMAEFALKVDLTTMFGNISDDSKIQEFHKNYEVCWGEMEARLSDMPAENSDRNLAFKKALDGAKCFVKEVVAERENMEIDEENQRFIDILINRSPDEETLLSDAITYVVGGFHTTANSLAWAFYFIAKDEDVQDRLIDELDDVIAKEKVIEFQDIPKLTYLKQVFDETLRCSVLAPFAARFQDEDSTLGGYLIPAGTPVVHALGVSLLNPVYFSNPHVFDPDRFSADKVKERPALAFQPFGFAGRRVCPGYRFANMEAAVMIATLLRKFRIKLVEGQDIKQVHGLVTHPSQEILISLQPRSK